jgi:hypothetical protein|tara:strand:- start:13113 stop:13382 length:270 start_codon:yes stop_codon:yes gene_type:complete
MADRDDAALKHYASRSQQPKVLAAKGAVAPPPSTNINITFDQGFGSISDEISDTRFRYMGVAAPISQYDRMYGQRTKFGCMDEGFNAPK